VSQREREIHSKPHATVASSDPSDGRDLSEAIESLPEIILKKANLEAHTNILQVLLSSIRCNVMLLSDITIVAFSLVFHFFHFFF
jgi:hypothetical protein